MTQSTLNRLQKDIEKIYNNLKKKNLFKQIFSVLHKVLSVESQMVITPNNGCIKGIFNGCSKWRRLCAVKASNKNITKKYFLHINIS